MHNGVKALIPVIFSALVMAGSGCISMDPQALAMASPMVQGFLAEHPNAEIKITHFTAEQAEQIIEQIRSECDNPYIGAKEFYRVNMTDPDTDLVAVAWIDWESRQIECVWKIGTGGKDIDKPKEEKNCEHHYKYACKGGHIYWFDSCGNKEDLKEYCSEGCSEAKNVCWGETQCKSHAEYRCYGDHVYWFDSCGKRQEKKEYCESGCELGFCREKESCEEAGGYCVYSATACAADARECPDGTWVGRVPPNCEFAPCPEYENDSVTGAVPSDSVTASIHEETPVSIAIEEEVFCGWSTEYACESDSDCAPGGCSSHVCGGADESITTTCEYRDCYDADRFGTICGCYEGECKWGYRRAEPIVISAFACREGYAITGDYWCPDDGLCCMPESRCDETDGGYDIYQSGCSESGDSRLCDHCNDDGTLTEKYCTDSGEIKAKSEACPEGYVCREAACVRECESNYDTVCHEGHVYWIDSCGKRQEKKEYCESGCAGGACIRECKAEGEYMQGTVSPEYQTACCEGLEGFDTSGGLLGAGLLCYDPVKGEPECLGEGTDEEGWYYSGTGELLKLEECAMECIEGAAEQCGETDIGMCEYGTKTCVNGEWSECEGAINPVDEACGDGLDNDCDGEVDEPCGA